VDLGRKFDVVTSPRDFRRSFDLPKTGTRKLDIGQINTHSRTNSNSSENSGEEVKHKRTNSQDFRDEKMVFQVENKHNLTVL
jgi:hypothetical protein